MSDNTKTIFERMEVPGWPGVFILGCFERPATLYMQQVRALNLVYALEQRDPNRKERVAVVGAGAAGVTAAAAAALLGWEVTIMDEHGNDVLSFAGSTASHRWLHPHIYDWPADDMHLPRAGLSILDWLAGPANQVIQALRTQWQPIRKARSIKTYLEACEISLNPLDGGYFVQWNSLPAIAGHAQERRLYGDDFGLVILAVGFGVEQSNDTFKEVTSYWAPDNYHANMKTPEGRRRILVSGTGDGGLIDVLRLSFNDFKHEHILHQLQNDWLEPGQYEMVRVSLMEIEASARSRRQDEQPYQAQLNSDYHRLIAKLSYKSEIIRRTDTSPVLTGMSSLPLTLEAAPINRFLYMLSKAPYIRGPLHSATKDDSLKKWKVTFAGNDEPQIFSDLIVRHGPTSALKRHFPDIFIAGQELAIKVGTGPDPTRSPLYDCAFSQRLSEAWLTVSHADGVPIADMQAAVSLPGPDSAITDYISRYRDAVIQDAHEFMRAKLERYVKPPAEQETVIDQPVKAANSASILADTAWVLSSPATKLITGMAGIGKTSLLRSLYVQMANDAQFLPIWLPVRQLRNAPKEQLREQLLSGAISDHIALPAELATGVRLRCAALFAMGRAIVFLADLGTLAPSDQAAMLRQISGLLDEFGRGNRLLADVSLRTPVEPEFASNIYELMPPESGLIPQAIQFIVTPGRATHLPGSQIYSILLSAFRADLVRAAAGSAEAAMSALGKLAWEQIRWNRENFSLQQLRLALAFDSADADADAIIASLVASGQLLLLHTDSDRYVFPHTAMRDCLACYFLLQNKLAFTMACELQFSNESAESDVPAMVIAQLADASLLIRLAAAPESLDWQVLRLRLRTIRHLTDVPAATLDALVRQLVGIVVQHSSADERLLDTLALDFRMAGPQACATLSRMIGEALVSASADAHWRVVRFVAQARPIGAIDLLSPYLNHPEGYLHKAAAAALGEIGDPAALPALRLAALAPPGDMINAEAYNAIARIGGDAACDILVGILNDSAMHDNFRWPAAQALAAMDKPAATAALLFASSSSSASIRNHALDALGSHHGTKVSMAIQEALGHSEALTRVAAAMALGRRRSVKAAKALGKSLWDADPGVRYAAAHALAKIQPSELLAELRKIIMDRAYIWRGEAAELLAATLGEPALRPLAMLCQESSSEVRAGAAAGLGYIRDAEAVQLLSRLARDEAATVRTAAIAALGQQPASAAGTELLLLLQQEQEGMMRDDVLRALINMPSAYGVQDVVFALEDSRIDRVTAIRALGALMAEEALAPLAAAWHRFNDDERAKRYIAHAMAQLDTTAGAASLRALYATSNHDGRATIINEALRRMRHPSAVALLIGASADEDVGDLATRNARSLPCAAVTGGLMLALKDSQPVVRRQAAVLTPFYADPALSGTLLDLEQNDADVTVRQAASDALRASRHRLG